MGAAQKRCCWSRLLVGFRRTPLSLAPKQEGAEPQPAGQHISRSTKRRRVRPHRHLCSRVQTQEGNEGLSEIACSARLRVGLGVAVVGDPWSPRTRTSPCLGCGLAAAAAATARRNWRRPRELARWVLLLAPGSCGCRWDMSFLQRSNITPQATLQNKHTRLGPASRFCRGRLWSLTGLSPFHRRSRPHPFALLPPAPQSAPETEVFPPKARPAPPPPTCAHRHQSPRAC